MQAAGKLVARGDDQKSSWLLLLYVDVRLIERSLGRSIEGTIFTPTFFSSSFILLIFILLLLWRNSPNRA